ncbi:hypothetical protein ZRA01_14520 [Zoogloea ramigera]|uniref:CzcB-like barrel-sandwich hybrid domain-containing protein n=1 Tax=Zoogloea ramigera TaxID=350 RepID=A0A4Y4CUB3_ZOORA|nr:HlyD family efflux transporter periplasmic adaptor subunit [Zoogloea ramigera]MBP6800860.1 HlyD family efflux transporter periplasmic adaptor subunit [Zoogloea sp.]GEC95379.1 hypothetical protein ZRA01_14520 [Zoogloea ramigera]
MRAAENHPLTDPWSAIARLDDDAEFAPAWLDRAVVGLGGAGQVREAVLVLGPANAGPFQARALWPAGQPCSAELATACEQALGLRLAVSRQVGAESVLAHPVKVADDLIGVVGVRFRLAGVPAGAAEWLRWGSGWLAVRLGASHQDEGDALRERLMTALDLLMLTLGEGRADDACRAVTTEAAVRLGCDRVAVGFARGKATLRLAALSHTADFARRLDLVRALEAAMTEAADQGQPIRQADHADNDPQPDGLVRRDHASLARDYGNGLILSVPFALPAADGLDRQEHGVFTFEWPEDAGIDPQAEVLASALPAILGHALVTKRRQERPLHLRLGDAGRRLTQRLVGPRHGAFKLGSLALVVAVLAGVFATGDFRISGDATLEGRVRRLIVAPFDGFVASAQARAGQVVKEGDILATLDDRELQLEASRWSSQQNQFNQQANDAEAQRNLAQIQIARAQSQQAEAQRQLSEAMMAKAQVRAPFAGLIVSGDLSQQLGGAVRKGQNLFEIAPLDAYRIVLQVAESDIAHLAVGQAGELVLTALPDRVIPFRVTLITAVAHTEGGRNVFRVEATPEAAIPDLRPGMAGVGKVSVGEARLVRIWTRRFVDWSRLQLWSWLGV